VITNLSLKDYQVWSDLTLELGPFTCIVGPSGYGKSSIVRALEAVFTTPSGLGHVRHGAQSHTLSIDLDPDISIVWYKSKKTNHYRITTGEDRQLLDKVGRKVPDEVAELLNLPLVDIGGTEEALYISHQFDPPFLIFESPQQAARLLMAVTGVDRLTAVQKEVGSDRRKVQVEKTVVTKRREELETDERLMKRARGCLRYQELMPVINRYKESAKREEELTKLQALAPEIPSELVKYPGNGEKYRVAWEDYQRLPQPVDEPGDKIFPVDTGDFQLTLSDLNRLLHLQSNLDAVDITARPLERPEVSNYDDMLARWNKLRVLQADLDDTNIKAGLAEQYLITVEMEYHETVEGTCPLCGQEWPDEDSVLR